MTYRTLWKLLIEREDLIWEVPVDCAGGVKDCISVCYWQIVKILFCWVSVSDCFTVSSTCHLGAQWICYYRT